MTYWSPSTIAIALLATFGSAVLLTPLLRDLAHSAGLVDASDGQRKLHGRPVPPVGGVAIVLAALIGGGALWATHLGEAAHAAVAGSMLPIVMAGALGMHLLGIIDDVRPMSARVKLVGQAAVAIAVTIAGVRIGTIAVPFLGRLTLTPAADLALTALWLVGITNAFNLIDGVDGLAPGVAAVALAGLIAVGALNAQWVGVVIAAVVAVATLGVLSYNLAPASVFLGDSGSLMLGFLLAGLALVDARRASGDLAAAVPLLILGLPALDTSIAVARRFLRGQPIFLPDRGHIHHRLLNLGYSARCTAYCLWGAGAVLALGGIALQIRPDLSATVLVVLLLAGALFVQHLRIHEFEELAGTLLRGARQRREIERTVRIREAAGRVEEVSNLDALFAALGDALGDAEIQRVELGLRQSFLSRPMPLRVSEGHDAQERVVWTHGETEPSPGSCELSFPLITATGQRIGSLTIWQQSNVRTRSTAQWRAIDCYLCPAVQTRLEALWHSSVLPRATARREQSMPSYRTRRDSVTQ